MGENKKENFKKIAAKRVDNVIRYVELLGNCGNTSRYEYDEVQVSKMFRAIRKSLSEAESKFKKSKNKSKNAKGFSFE